MGKTMMQTTHTQAELYLPAIFKEDGNKGIHMTVGGGGGGYRTQNYKQVTSISGYIR